MSASDEPLFRAAGVEKWFGRTRALSIPDLSIPRGGVTAVMGPNGAGKTTLLRILSLVDFAYSGTIYFEGRPLAKNSDQELAARRRIAVIWQRPRLFRSSVHDNIALGLRFRDISEIESRRRVRKVANELGIEHLLRKQCAGLSGGEAQKVSIARALVLEPDVLFIDEPNNSLDPRNIDLVEEIIKGRAASGTSVILVTHNVQQARDLADRVIFLNEGKVVLSGPAGSLFSNGDGSDVKRLMRYL